MTRVFGTGLGLCTLYPEIFRGDAEGFPIQVVE